jgi:predicted permease
MRYDLRFALRMILAHRWFSAAVVVTLALGIGLNTMVFTLVNAVLLKPVAIPGGERLVAVSNLSPKHGEERLRLSLPDLRDYQAQASSMESLQGVDDEDGILSEHGMPAQTYRLEMVSRGLFEMLHTRPVLGRGLEAGDHNSGSAPVVLLGYGIWKDRYASSASIVGHAVRVNGKPATIVGVMPKGFKFPSGTDMWMPLVPTPELEKRDNRQLRVFGMLKQGATLAQAGVEMNAIAHRLIAQYPATDKDLSIVVETFQQRFNGGIIRLIFLLMLAAVGFVLLIACANVANMMLTRALSRQREISIRAALGASRWRVVRQLLIESVLLSTLGGVLGLGLAVAGVHWFDMATQDVGKPYWIEFTMDYPVFGVFAALCIASGLLFGIVPALRSSRVNLNEVMKEGARSAGGYRGGRFSAVLVVFQFALTLVLLTGAGIFVHSLLRNLSANRFLPAKELMTARIDFPEDRYKETDSRQRVYDQLLPRLRALPGVTHAAIVSDLPGLGAGNREIELEGAPIDVKTKRPQASFLVQSPGYLQTIGLPLLLGRDFNERDGDAGHKAAMLTRQCADHFWPGQEALGKRFRFYENDKAGDWITVVGVTANMNQELNEQAPNPLLFVPYRQEGWNGMALVVRSTINPTAGVRTAIEQIDDELPLRNVSMYAAAVEHQEWFLQIFSMLFLGFAMIALLMASVGLYAVIAHATGSRTQEIGVRMALGADARNILLLVMRRGLWQIGAGLVLGLAAAFPVARLMKSLPIGASPSDPVVFAVVAVMLSAVGLFACWLPARRAAALDPVKAIRYE